MRLNLANSNPINEGVNTFATLSNVFAQRDKALRDEEEAKFQRQRQITEDAEKAVDRGMNRQVIQSTLKTAEDKRTADQAAADGMRMRSPEYVPTGADMARYGMDGRLLPVLGTTPDPTIPLAEVGHLAENAGAIKEDYNPEQVQRQSAGTAPEQVLQEKKIIYDSLGKLEKGETLNPDEHKAIAKEFMLHPGFASASGEGLRQQYETLKQVGPMIDQLDNVKGRVRITNPEQLQGFAVAFPRVLTDSKLQNPQVTGILFESAESGKGRDGKFIIELAGTDPQTGKPVQGVLTDGRGVNQPDEPITVMSGGQWADMAHTKKLLIDGALQEEVAHGSDDARKRVLKEADAKRLGEAVTNTLVLPKNKAKDAGEIIAAGGTIADVTRLLKPDTVKQGVHKIESGVGMAGGKKDVLVRDDGTVVATGQPVYPKPDKGDGPDKTRQENIKIAKAAIDKAADDFTKQRIAYIKDAEEYETNRKSGMVTKEDTQRINGLAADLQEASDNLGRRYAQFSRDFNGEQYTPLTSNRGKSTASQAPPQRQQGATPITGMAPAPQRQVTPQASPQPRRPLSSFQR